MLISLDSQDTRPIYVQIVDEVRRALVLGTLGPDDPLPSVRELAVTLRVNPNTVSQAYRELERQGMVYVRRGQGTYATPDQVKGVERRALARDVAQRAVHDARRNGLGTDELVEAIRSYDISHDTSHDTQRETEETP
ncbi:MAG: GntR family transcriptional regulator [Gemmatimonadaceae bacterium]